MLRTPIHFHSLTLFNSNPRGSDAHRLGEAFQRPDILAEGNTNSLTTPRVPPILAPHECHSRGTS